MKAQHLFVALTIISAFGVSNAANYAVYSQWLDSNCNTDSYFNPNGASNIRVVELNKCVKNSGKYYKIVTGTNKITQTEYTDSSCTTAKANTAVDILTTCKSYGGTFQGNNQGKNFPSPTPVYFKVELNNQANSPVASGTVGGKSFEVAAIYYLDKDCTETGVYETDKSGNKFPTSEGYTADQLGVCQKNWYLTGKSWKLTGSASACFVSKAYSDASCSSETSSTKYANDGTCYKIRDNQWARVWYRAGTKSPADCDDGCTASSCPSGQFCGETSKTCKDMTCENYKAEECATGTWSCAIAGGTTAKSCVKASSASTLLRNISTLIACLFISAFLA